MGYSSSVWAYGNSLDPENAGCVFNNEGDRTRSYEGKTFGDFINSPIGCCNDYANLLTVLLTNFGINNRQVLIGGHIFNEITLDTPFLFRHKSGRPNDVFVKKMVLDSTIDFVYLNDWKTIQFTSDKFQVIVLPHPSSDVDSENYRPLLTGFQQMMLKLAERGGTEFSLKDGVPENLVKLLAN